MIKLYAVGSIKDAYLQEGINIYLKRLKPYTKVEVIEVPEGNKGKKEGPAEIEGIKQREAEALLAKIKKDEWVVLLDLHGQAFTSEEFQLQREKWLVEGKGNLAFVIAGSYGFGQALLDRANARWCLSSCTFLHGMVRLLLLEQLYRSYKIEGHEPYHK